VKYKFEEIAINSTTKKKPVDSDKFHYIGLEHLDSQSLQVVRFGSEVAPKGEKLIMKKGDVLFGKRRAYQKKVGIAPFDGIFSAHGMVLRPNEKIVSKSFFPFFISSDYFLDKAISISVGSLSPTINWSDLKVLEFDLPSLEEQERLAKVLWKIEEVKNQILFSTENYNTYFERNFNELIERDVIYKPINDIAFFYKKSKLPASSGLDSGEYIFFTSGLKKSFVNDFMLNDEGIIINDGGSALIRYFKGKFSYSDHVICIKSRDAEVLTKYLFYILKSKENEIDKDLFKGTGLRNIDKKAFKTFEIPVISKERQIEIIQKLEQFEKIKKNLKEEKNKNSLLQKQIIKEAFNV
jgi:type I restriction enzyme S subunit